MEVQSPSQAIAQCKLCHAVIPRKPIAMIFHMEEYHDDRVYQEIDLASQQEFIRLIKEEIQKDGDQPDYNIVIDESDAEITRQFASHLSQLPPETFKNLLCDTPSKESVDKPLKRGSFAKSISLQNDCPDSTNQHSGLAESGVRVEVENLSLEAKEQDSLPNAVIDQLLEKALDAANEKGSSPKPVAKSLSRDTDEKSLSLVSEMNASNQSQDSEVKALSVGQDSVINTLNVDEDSATQTLNMGGDSEIITLEQQVPLTPPESVEQEEMNNSGDSSHFIAKNAARDLVTAAAVEAMPGSPQNSTSDRQESSGPGSPENSTGNHRVPGSPQNSTGDLQETTGPGSAQNSAGVHAETVSGSPENSTSHRRETRGPVSHQNSTGDLQETTGPGSPENSTGRRRETRVPGSSQNGAGDLQETTGPGSPQNSAHGKTVPGSPENSTGHRKETSGPESPQNSAGVHTKTVSGYHENSAGHHEETSGPESPQNSAGVHGKTVSGSPENSAGHREETSGPESPQNSAGVHTKTAPGSPENSTGHRREPGSHQNSDVVLKEDVSGSSENGSVDHGEASRPGPLQNGASPSSLYEKILPGPPQNSADEHEKTTTSLQNNVGNCDKIEPVSPQNGTGEHEQTATGSPQNCYCEPESLQNSTGMHRTTAPMSPQNSTGKHDKTVLTSPQNGTGEHAKVMPVSPQNRAGKHEKTALGSPQDSIGQLEKPVPASPQNGTGTREKTVNLTCKHCHKEIVCPISVAHRHFWEQHYEEIQKDGKQNANSPSKIMTPDMIDSQFFETSSTDSESEDEMEENPVVDELPSKGRREERQKSDTQNKNCTSKNAALDMRHPQFSDISSADPESDDEMKENLVIDETPDPDGNDSFNLQKEPLYLVVNLTKVSGTSTNSADDSSNAWGRSVVPQASQEFVPPTRLGNNLTASTETASQSILAESGGVNFQDNTIRDKFVKPTSKLRVNEEIPAVDNEIMASLSEDIATVAKTVEKPAQNIEKLLMDSPRTAKINSTWKPNVVSEASSSESNQTESFPLIIPTRKSSVRSSYSATRMAKRLSTAQKNNQDKTDATHTTPVVPIPPLTSKQSAPKQRAAPVKANGNKMAAIKRSISHKDKYVSAIAKADKRAKSASEKGPKKRKGRSKSFETAPKKRGRKRRKTSIEEQPVETAFVDSPSSVDDVSVNDDLPTASDSGSNLHNDDFQSSVPRNARNSSDVANEWNNAYENLSSSTYAANPRNHLRENTGYSKSTVNSPNRASENTYHSRYTADVAYEGASNSSYAANAPNQSSGNLSYFRDTANTPNLANDNASNTSYAANASNRVSENSNYSRSRVNAPNLAHGNASNSSCANNSPNQASESSSYSRYAANAPNLAHGNASNTSYAANASNRASESSSYSRYAANAPNLAHGNASNSSCAKNSPNQASESSRYSRYAANATNLAHGNASNSSYAANASNRASESSSDSRYTANAPNVALGNASNSSYAANASNRASESSGYSRYAANAPNLSHENARYSSYAENAASTARGNASNSAANVANKAHEDASNSEVIVIDSDSSDEEEEYPTDYVGYRRDEFLRHLNENSMQDKEERPPQDNSLKVVSVKSLSPDNACPEISRGPGLDRGSFTEEIIGESSADAVNSNTKTQTSELENGGQQCAATNDSNSPISDDFMPSDHHETVEYNPPSQLQQSDNSPLDAGCVSEAGDDDFIDDIPRLSPKKAKTGKRKRSVSAEKKSPKKRRGRKKTVKNVKRKRLIVSTSESDSAGVDSPKNLTKKVGKQASVWEDLCFNSTQSRAATLNAEVEIASSVSTPECSTAYDSSSNFEQQEDPFDEPFVDLGMACQLNDDNSDMTSPSSEITISPDLVLLEEQKAAELCGTRNEDVVPRYPKKATARKSLKPSSKPASPRTVKVKKCIECNAIVPDSPQSFSSHRQACENARFGNC